MISDAGAWPAAANASSWGSIPGVLMPGGQRQVADRASWAGPNGNHTHRPSDSRPRRFRDIKELQALAASLDVDVSTSLHELLFAAREAIQQVDILSERGQLDLAYVQYLRSSEIAINIIPKHPDYRSISTHQPGWWEQYRGLISGVQAKESLISEIKQEILFDNGASSIQSQGQVNPIPEGHPDSEEGLVRMPSPTGFQQRPMSSGGQYSHASIAALNSEPDIPARRPVSGSPNSTEELARRFEKLRTAPSASGTSNGTATIPTVPSNRRPLGPRSMGGGKSAPAVPAKVPLSPLDSSLPRAPSPTYSPIWTVPVQPPPNPPRASTESTRSINSRFVSNAASSPRGSPSRGAFGIDDNPYRSQTPNGLHQAKMARSNSADIPYGTTILVDKLIECLEKYNVLLIDVRPRDQYDGGHIYAKNILCIEPVALKENVSAEELEERLVVSPEVEQSLFERRNEFDLVVYYDQSTVSTSYLAGSPAGCSSPALRALHDTLYEFNAYKPLKDGRPPALLAGGLDAWADIMGQQSLVMSQTTAAMSSLHRRKPVRSSGRPLGRVPTMVSANSSLEIRKRRLREYRPLNPEEERQWLEKSKNEEIDPGAYGAEGDSSAEEQEYAEPSGLEASSQFIHTYEDFLRRFPEPRAIQQSMIMPELPEEPSSPRYVAYHDPSLPVAPSRPPPAVPRPSYSGISDNRNIQPTLARQNSASRAAPYTSHAFLSRLKLPRTGLHNFGVTCYMNSTIQCLNATVALSKFFIDDRFRYYIQKNWKGSQGIMPGLYANLIRSLWKGDVQVILPTSFRNFCGRMNREWVIDRQQDAKEFFDFLVDCLHEDLNINWQRTPLRPLTFEEEMQRERMPVPRVSKIEWDRYCHREESYISSIFAGQHASRLRCTTCQRTSTTYEAFYSISVEIPPSGNPDIHQCLHSYTQEERLSGDEVWKCPYCKCEREATKQIILTRAPQFLVVHFKRFSASKTQSARKIHTPVNFPLHGLNLDRFIIPSPPKASANGDPSVQPALPDQSTTPPFLYDAYAVLRHIGASGNGGHYVSLVRDAQRQSWRKFDDERVTDFNPRDLPYQSRLQNEQAYLVFYERVPAK